METTTKLKVQDLATYCREGDPHSGTTVLIVAVNPMPAAFMPEEHYRIYVPGWPEMSYAYAHELTPKFTERVK